jgi:hypothetical protein
MSKRLLTLATAIVCCLLINGRAQAQAHDEPPKYEVGALFSSISLTPGNGYRTEAGFGGRFTVNLTDHLGLEAETVFFPNRGFSAERRASGRAVQSLFGVKAGQRWEKWGVFAKGRPGLISFSAGREVFVLDSAGNFVSSHFERATHFAFDVGGVLEFYPTRHIVTRFDAGDTIIRYGRQTITFPGFPPFPPTTFTDPVATRHNFQFNAGIGYRFD